ncbi:hypothetical protein GOODEAATRI_011637, partial [Goodea atripinnis]
AVLSTIVFVNLKGMFKQFTDIPMLWRTNSVDLVSLALPAQLKSCLPRYSILGNVAGTDLYLDTEAYREIFVDFGDIGVAIYLAGCQACVVEQMERANLFSESIPKSWLFVSVHDAVLHILKKLGEEDVVLVSRYSSHTS